MILSDRGDDRPDSTPMQWRPDLERCQYCITNQEHSQHAHEDAIDGYYQTLEAHGNIKQESYSIQINPPVVGVGSNDRHSIKTRSNSKSGYSMAQVLAMI